MASFRETLDAMASGINVKNVNRAKIVGVRTAQDTKMLATYNYGIYSVLVEYNDGSRTLSEHHIDEPFMRAILPKLEW